MITSVGCFGFERQKTVNEDYWTVSAPSPESGGEELQVRLDPAVATGTQGLFASRAP